MVKKLADIDFKNQVGKYEEQFEMVQVLDPKGKVVDQETIDKISEEELVKLMENIVWGRALDERTIILNRQGALGNYATAGGQEASQFGPITALEDGDFFLPTYRDLGAFIKFGLPMHKAFLWYKGHMAGNQYEKDFQAYVPQVIVGATPTHGAGVAIGKKLNGSYKDNVVLTFTGDAATSQGDFYEGINFAGAFKAPLITVIQNNRYGISVPVHKQTAAKTLAQKGVAAGILSFQVDGMDPVAMYAAVKKARDYATEGNGPVLIEALTYRYGPHTMSDDPKRYREDIEVDDWRKKDPIVRLRNYLIEKNLWDEEKEEKIRENCFAEVKEAMKLMAKEPKQKVSDFLKYMYEDSPQNIKEQIDIYEKKEMN